ncbi:hypothetical protein HJC23_001259 [Cyclotella cryptica]|uniref:Sulfate transporter n=1 Tax=Cyclotella cryptica TaxID=29204 RepID=A0ABD3PEL8_9STRA|eukprot:CCRYP_015419-RA/>CCRYP_015419-RA protein AED:0.02 eAED:0.02 QI:236/1/1/1/1/1/3/506/1048
MEEQQALLSPAPTANNDANHYGTTAAITTPPPPPPQSSHTNGSNPHHIHDAPSSPRRYHRTISSHDRHSTLLLHNPLEIIDIDTSHERRRPSSVAALAVAEVILHDRRERRESQFVSTRGLSERMTVPPFSMVEDGSLGSLSTHGDDDNDEKEENGHGNEGRMLPSLRESMRSSKQKHLHKTIADEVRTSYSSRLIQIASQIPAVAIVSVLNFMIGIPFGASYFPVEWSNTVSSSSSLSSSSPYDNDNGTGPSGGEFPLSGKEALGLRMFLFSTAMAQLAFTYTSKFTNGVGLQMVENVPFCLELARIVMMEVGCGRDALSTLFFLFGLSSVLVGAVFYVLGKFALGRVVYFFPSHVLVGCIGGIGAFIITTSLEVSTNTTFHFTMEGIRNCILQQFYLLAPVLAFEVLLRTLMHVTDHRYPLLAPIYYCAITPVFYLMLWGFDLDFDAAEQAGYFFPPLSASGSVLNKELFQIFNIIDLRTVSWTAVIKSVPTMVSLTAFSLIHVPINIPAFAISTNVDPDMNAELIAHGYSNTLSGIFGGLQNYMAYSNSVIYSKAKGEGKASSLGIVLTTALIFVYGPTMASFVPRCMAGTLLLHVGVDLFLEGVYESWNDYDRLEYAGIWLITVVMVSMGMDAALVAGVIAALSTYAVQSITYQYPIRGAMTATRLRSSAWNRSSEAEKILMDPITGRQRIYVIQMQGHIFFGNATTMSDEINKLLTEKLGTECQPIVVILDFSPVLGMDSSAAQAIAKLNNSIRNNFHVEIVIFVSGREDGFPCAYDLSQKVDKDACFRTSSTKQLLQPDIDNDDPLVFEPTQPHDDMSIGDSLAARAMQFRDRSKGSIMAEIPNSRVCASLDDALIFAEDVLIALRDMAILQGDVNERFSQSHRSAASCHAIEEDGAKMFLATLCRGASSADVESLFRLFLRETYYFDDVIWKQGDTSDSLKLLVDGSLISLLEDEHGATETIHPGSTIGELGLVNGSPRLTTVKVLSNEAILYSLSKERWLELTRDDPRIARYIDLLVVRYLAHRVQHVSNHILDRRSLPV